MTISRNPRWPLKILNVYQILIELDLEMFYENFDLAEILAFQHRL